MRQKLRREEAEAGRATALLLLLLLPSSLPFPSCVEVDADHHGQWTFIEAPPPFEVKFLNRQDRPLF
ncbi:hypothetical protein O9929_18575 [Vibrio lentus]|nr:hypothetical protein [Vibrio lentus]